MLYCFVEVYVILYLDVVIMVFVSVYLKEVLVMYLLENVDNIMLKLRIEVIYFFFYYYIYGLKKYDGNC